MRKLYADATNINGIESITISTSHSSSVATAQISCIEADLDIGDEVTIDLGYVDDHGQVFNGYVKNKDLSVPDNKYQLTIMDRLVRAVDYFIVSSSPQSPYNFGTGISAENLINNVLGLCGLSLSYIDATNFSFGVKNPVEVNLVSAFDYARMIADIVTWSIWCDEMGLIHFKNRKPFLMGSNDFGQIAWTPDTSILTLDDTSILSFNYKRDEKDLRNRVTVFGGNNITSRKDNSLSWDDLDGPSGNYIQVLPNDFYKTIVASYIFIEDQSTADKTAEYNLGLYNRIKNSCSVLCEGNHRLLARRAITINEAVTGINADWYILSSELSFAKDQGFTCSLECSR